jgi:hypothetical protein
MPRMARMRIASAMRSFFTRMHHSGVVIRIITDVGECGVSKSQSLKVSKIKTADSQRLKVSKRVPVFSLRL